MISTHRSERTLIEPVASLEGGVRLPGDKSIAHRYALLGAMACGTTRIGNYPESADCLATLGCLRKLGVRLSAQEGRVHLSSPGWRNLSPPSGPLEAHNSGTLIRLLSGVLSGCPFESTLVGDASLNRRPMSRIIRPLRLMGADITGVQSDGRETPPLTIRGGRLRGIRCQPEVASAQIKSCVLLAGLTAEGSTQVLEGILTRDHSERAFPHFGADFEWKAVDQGYLSSLGGRRDLAPAEGLEVPGDFSGAVFFLVAASLLPGSDLTLLDVGLNPTRTALLDILRKAGADLEILNRRQLHGEPRGDLRIRHSQPVLEHFPSLIQGQEVAQLIDELPALAILGTRLKDGLCVRGAQDLRVKESDRIRSVVAGLRRIGVPAVEFPDGFQVPPATIRGTASSENPVVTEGDHRIAMAFAIAGLLSETGVAIDDPECAKVSFPDFFGQLKAIRAEL